MQRQRNIQLPDRVLRDLPLDDTGDRGGRASHRGGVDDAGLGEGCERGRIHPPIPCSTRNTSCALETAVEFRRIPPSGPVKRLIELFAVSAPLLNASHATFAAGVSCKSSSAPSTV